MRFAIVGDHREHFRRHGWVEFEELLTKEDVSALNGMVDAVMSKRLGVRAGELALGASEALQHGRDLWRDDPQIRKIVCRRRFAEVASNLLERRSMRLAYDQLLVRGSLHHEEGKPSDILSSISTLSEVSAVQGVVGALILSLKGEAGLSDSAAPFLPSAPGFGLFLSAAHPIQWKSLLEDDFLGEASSRYLMIVYAEAKALYILNTRDPHVHRAKGWGLVFGDRLEEPTFPLLIR